MEDLLDWLVSQAHVMYLSDLRQPRYWPRIEYLLERSDTKQFSLKEWEEAITYIFALGNMVEYRDVTEAREDFRKCLGRNSQEKNRDKQVEMRSYSWPIWKRWKH